jgi:hypothetical protein
MYVSWRADTPTFNLRRVEAIRGCIAYISLWQACGAFDYPLYSLVLSLLTPTSQLQSAAHKQICGLYIRDMNNRHEEKCPRFKILQFYE